MTKAERRELQEKQRAAKAAAKAPGSSGQTNKPATKQPEGGGEKPSGKQSGKQAPGSTQPQAHHQRRASRVGAISGEIPRPGGGPGGNIASDLASKNANPRGVRIFSHFGLQHKSGTGKGLIHPVVVRLGLLFADFRITGANARCLATLTAFKHVIQDYTTPQNNTLSRHLMTHLSAQISHLVAARPMSVTMGNAIRQLKVEISGVDIDLPEQDAKEALCEKIDNYIQERITAAGQVIAQSAGYKIKNGDVLLTYARSSVVEQVLLRAHGEGKNFSVYVVDSRPMLEGKKLLAALSSAGIPCTYLLLPAIGSVIAEVSTVFTGAHSLHSNGAVHSRAGTALVSMMAKQHSIPVVVCCETYKISETLQLDSFTKNELGPLNGVFSTFPISIPRESLATENTADLEILNPLYDLTPPKNITAVVTEVGVIPPTSIGTIHMALGRMI